MANFTIADIKALREQLGTGMVDTKKALEEADGDVDKAIEILRLKGAKGNAKRADRSTSEGLVTAREEGGKVTLIELACETDFVAKNDRFIALADWERELLEQGAAEEVAEVVAEAVIEAEAAEGIEVLEVDVVEVVTETADGIEVEVVEVDVVEAPAEDSAE